MYNHLLFLSYTSLGVNNWNQVSWHDHQVGVSTFRYYMITLSKPLHVSMWHVESERGIVRSGWAIYGPLNVSGLQILSYLASTPMSLKWGEVQSKNIWKATHGLVMDTVFNQIFIGLHFFRHRVNLNNQKQPKFQFVELYHVIVRTHVHAPIHMHWETPKNPTNPHYWNLEANCITSFWQELILLAQNGWWFFAVNPQQKSGKPPFKSKEWLVF